MNVFDLTQQELIDRAASTGEKPFRGKQLYRQIYKNLTLSSSEMTDLPLSFRKITDEWNWERMRLKQVFEGDQGMTHKALFEIQKGIFIETVLMRYPDRATVCVSTQAGCPLGCVFCATGKMGFLQDLSVGQIVYQVLWAEKELRRRGKRLSNVVFMGMGEPFNNYNNWWKAVERLHDPEGFNLGARSFTVSTVGLIPGILRLADESLPVNLAISLHAINNELRSRMMPVNKKYPISKLLEAVRIYTAKTRRRVSFEYILLQEENDSLEEAGLLAKRLTRPERLLCHVNLIPWNPVPGTHLKSSQKKRVEAFRKILEQNNIPCTIRHSRGVDINAACGQLAGNV